MKNTTVIKRIATQLTRSSVSRLANTIHLALPRAEIFLVGGFLRDTILGRATKDVDLVVRGVPGRALEKFLRTQGTVNLVGRTFGVFKFIPKKGAHETIDIALPRTDHAWGTGGYRDVEVQSDWKLPIADDLSRRDFTVNAMAWNLLTNELVDPYDGLVDLKKKSLRAVGAPAIRFKEDYSRMLRGIRFACQLNFSIEKNTWAATHALIAKLNSKRAGERVVPYEVIAKELLKMFLANPVRALELLDEAGAVKSLMPELLKMKKCPQPPEYHTEGDVWKHTKLALAKIMTQRFEKKYGPRNAEIVFATLFHDIAKPATITFPKKKGERIRFEGHDLAGAIITKKIAERLRLSSFKDEKIDVDADRLATLVRYHLVPISGDPRIMRATTIERHYLRNERVGKELLALHFVDGSATIGTNGKGSIGALIAIEKRISVILGSKRRTLPPPIIDGNEIMRLLKLAPGPMVGKIIETLREAQLSGTVKTKKDARTFLETIDETSEKLELQGVGKATRRRTRVYVDEEQGPHNATDRGISEVSDVKKLV